VGQRAGDLTFCGGPRIAARNLAACIAFAVLSASALHAATITVVNSLDSGIGSLRDAVALANAGDTIDFAPALAGGTIVLTSGEILIDKNLTITGPGASALAVSGNNASRVFNVTGGMVFISGLTISSGLSGAGGGGLYNAGTLSLSSSIVSGNSAFAAIPGSLCGGVGTNGGGIYNAGTLTLTDSTVSGNSSFGNCGGGFGGGIYNHPQGTLTVSKSTLSANGSALGGGIYNDGTVNNGGTVMLSNSTISANGVAGSGGGGGIFNFSQGPDKLLLTNTTITNNGALGSGSGIASLGTLAIAFAGNNNIVAGNTGSADIDGPFSGIRNIVGTTANLFLGPLANNGGPTLTHALLPGSTAAIGRGDLTTCTTPPVNSVDQRGQPRGPIACSIGAYEPQGGPGARSSTASIPALSNWMLALLAMLLVGSVALADRGRRRKSGR
jgi:hypothetical protein